MEKHIVSNGCKIVYARIVRNNSPADIVLIHGYGVDHTMWEPQVEYLKDKYGIINVDVRGYGKSRPCGAFTIKQAAVDVRNILAAEGCTRYILVGLSMGGYIAQEYAFSLRRRAGIYDHRRYADFSAVLFTHGKTRAQTLDRDFPPLSLEYTQKTDDESVCAHGRMEEKKCCPCLIP